MLIFIFLSSGLFLGWSLGANDAANVFGTAVGSKMVKFRTAAIITGVFVILGAWVSGSGAADTLSELGSVNEIAGAFVVCLAAAFTIYMMTKMDLPVSSSQAIVGAIVGWNIFTGYMTDFLIMNKILSTWILCPVLSALFSMAIYRVSKSILKKKKIHLLKLDHYNRIGLIIAGAFGAYTLGANNIANVMGVFVPVTPFKPLSFGYFHLTGTEELFILGGISIAVGVFTFSERLMNAVGSGIMRLRPETALIVVFSSALVLFLFSSENLEWWLASNNLPTIPLVPVSSSQAIVGGIVGIGLAHGGRGINFPVLGKIASGWITTPLMAGILSFFALFFVQNVFQQPVYKPAHFSIMGDVFARISKEGINTAGIEKLAGKSFDRETSIYDEIERVFPDMLREDIMKIIRYCEVKNIFVDTNLIKSEIQSGWLSSAQLAGLRKINGMNFRYAWEFTDALTSASIEWKMLPAEKINKIYNRNIGRKMNYLIRKFQVSKNGNGKI